jgi:xylulokinase
MLPPAMPSHSTRTLWLGIDLGTQSAKAALWQAAAGQRGGCVVGEGSYRYDVHYPRLGWAEQAPRDWEAALGPIVQAALTQAGARKSEVAAIGVTGQLDGTIAVDPAGEPVSPALIWQDRRASCALSLSASRVQELTGQVLDASHLAPKARYLLGERGLAGVRFHQPVSYLVERLTGRAVMDPALASMTLLLDLHARRWSAELCAAWGVPLTCLPELAPADELAAPLSARGAALTGLPAGVPVCVGTGDDFAAALGAGLLRPGRVSCSLGTAEVVGALSDTAVIDRVTDHVTGHAAPIVETHLYPTGGYFIENPGWTCGGAVAWLRRLVGISGDRELDDLAAAVPAGCDGVGFFPALAGAMTPAWNADARGAFFGLSSEHGRGHLARAVLEGSAFACRDVVERLAALGVPTERLLLSGGGSASALWAQLHADVLGRPVELAARADATVLGAIMLAALASGGARREDLPALAGAPRHVLTPRPSTAGDLERAYQRYRRHAAALLAATPDRDLRPL